LLLLRTKLNLQCTIHVCTDGKFVRITLHQRNFDKSHTVTLSTKLCVTLI